MPTIRVREAKEDLGELDFPVEKPQIGTVSDDLGFRYRAAGVVLERREERVSRRQVERRVTDQ